jgi:hypothetical protein
MGKVVFVVNEIIDTPGRSSLIVGEKPDAAWLIERYYYLDCDTNANPRQLVQ